MRACGCRVGDSLGAGERGPAGVGRLRPCGPCKAGGPLPCPSSPLDVADGCPLPTATLPTEVCWPLERHSRSFCRVMGSWEPPRLWLVTTPLLPPSTAGPAPRLWGACLRSQQRYGYAARCRATRVPVGQLACGVLGSDAVPWRWARPGGGAAHADGPVDAADKRTDAAANCRCNPAPTPLPRPPTPMAPPPLPALNSRRDGIGARWHRGAEAPTVGHVRRWPRKQCTQSGQPTAAAGSTP